MQTVAKTNKSKSKILVGTVLKPATAENPFLTRTVRLDVKVTSGLCGTLKRAQSILINFKEQFRPDFSQWIEENWHVWQSFCQEAEVVWNSGRKRYSARTIVEFIRHETALRQSAGGYKINNSYVPDLGRLYGLMKKSRGSFFECRTMANPIVRRVIRGPAMAQTWNIINLKNSKSARSY